jgi:tRNA pseudouridine synthase A 1
LELGRGRMSLAQLEEILEMKDRTLAGPTAPAKGLCLMDLDYGDFQTFLL